LKKGLHAKIVKAKQLERIAAEHPRLSHPHHTWQIGIRPVAAALLKA
jgi:hypothetical protein